MDMERIKSYGDNDARRTWFSFTCLRWCVFHTLHRSVLEPVTKARHAEASVFCKEIGTLRTIFMKLVQVCLLN